MRKSLTNVKLAGISWSVRVSYMIGSVVDKKTDKDCNVEGQTARL